MALNRREKMLLGLPALLGGLMLFYHVVHEPLVARRAEAQTRQEKIEDELKRDQSKLVKEGNLNARRARVTAQEQLVDSWVPGKNSAALFIWHLSQAEQYSGAHVKGLTVGERREVFAAPQKGKAESGNRGDNEQSQVSSLLVVGLDVKVDARFAEHLLFQQMLEEVPLFLNIDALGLARAEQWPIEQVGTLLQAGDLLRAEQLLKMNPMISGTYHLNLYFKATKPGPSTDAMHFSSDSGRSDPFVMDGVDTFLQTILDYYARPGGASGAPPIEDQGYPGRGEREGQMG